MRDHDIWYVSYRTNITPKRDDGERRSVRATRKFKAEAEAKQFAEEIIKDGWSGDCRDLESPYAEENGSIDTNSRLDCWQTEKYLGARLCALPVGIVMS